MDILIVGCGDTGRRLAERHKTAGDTMLCCTRSEVACHSLQKSGFRVHRLDLDNPPDKIDFARADVVYMLAPPGGNGTYDPRTEALLTLLESIGRPGRLVYISTSGVYGDCEGAWVDESWPRRPSSQRAMRRAAAEQQLEAWSEHQQTALVILRVPGIYGPGRLPIERIQRGEPVLKENEAPWSNRIHIADLVEACWLAGTHPDAAGIYNVGDGHPTSMTDYFNRVADICGLPRPPQISRSEAEQLLTPGMLSLLNESRRIDNTRLRESLGVQLRYPDLEAGMNDCF